MKYKLVVILFLLGFNTASAQEGSRITKDAYQNIDANKWVDSVFNSMTAQERIGQLFMAAAYSNRGAAHEKEVLALVEKYKIGGLIFFQGGPLRQARQANMYQAVSKIPLIIAMDAEWGVGMRLDSTVNLPYQMALGAIQNDSLIYEMGREVANNFKRLGMHINFAPVVDINNNPKNPVINYRSFGENREKVTAKSLMYALGMQDNDIIATAKHFPGHGDTAVDSHYGLPIINHSKKRLDSIELYPFRKMIEGGIASIMIAHMNIPILDDTPKTPSTLSRPIVTDLLKNELGFDGLIVSDAMNMKGVTKYFEIGEADVKALQAGNDLLEVTLDIPKAINAVEKALKTGVLSRQELAEKCKKVLLSKYLVGLDKYEKIQTKDLFNELNNPSINLINRKLSESSVTVLRNENAIFPIKNLDKVKIATLSIGKTTKRTDFQNMAEKYTKMDHYNLSTKSNQQTIAAIEKKLAHYDIVLVGMHQVRKRPSNNSAYPQVIVKLVNRLAKTDKSIIAVFRNAYTLDKFTDIEKSKGLLMSYYQSTNTQEVAAQVIFGGLGASGTLPVSVDEHFSFGDGITLAGGIRFGYTVPEDVNMDSKILKKKIDSLVHQAIDLKATPGARVLIVKDQKIIFDAAYGTHTFTDTIAVKSDDIYDMASITKVTTALPILMKLLDEGKFDLDAPLKKYLPELKNSNKGNLIFRDVLAHQARLKPWIPYWKSAIKKNGGYKARTFKIDTVASESYPVKITDNLFLHKNFKNKIYKAIKKSPLEKEKKYKYSGLLFYLLPKMVAQITNDNYEHYLYSNFYHQMGAYTLKYNPTKYFSLDRIAPTEYDFPFRKVLIHGRVHDEGAAVMGGVSANAGLFGNAYDLAKLFQMYLNMGSYGGKQFVSEETMKEFTKYQFPENNNRRGLGFDKPSFVFDPNGNAAKDASAASFGHTGYTGPRVWADPKHNLLYIFLANRVNPTRENRKLYQLNTRTKIEQVIYDSFLE